MSVASRAADTDAQEETIDLIERVCFSQAITVELDSTVGKRPQAVILRQDMDNNQICVYPDGRACVVNRFADVPNIDVSTENAIHGWIANASEAEEARQ